MQLRDRLMLQGVAGLTASSILLMGSVAFAQSAAAPTQQQAQGGWGMHGGRGMGMRPGVFGTVLSVSGNTITITSKGRPMRNSDTTQTSTTYTVDATSATVEKDGETSSVANIAIGDMIMVQGTVNGTSVTAAKINDGMPKMGRGWGMGSSTRPHVDSIIKGNGEPVIGGSVSAINGNTLTVMTAQGGQTYSIDASNAVVEKDNATSSVSAIAVGDKVVVQGTVNGASVSASSVIDNGTTAGMSARPGFGGGFFGRLGGFFHRLFGFF